ncbi:hypothetical protein LSUE1_G008799 [Lachnellula suecica]|uniref:Uncharacterized protein n=1 Tax=Lachnellula suecica TaxID=602035 RepID=A0A8T9BW74_9HELO|nr:hypothetical protein LSUE1_G008799 [Lachnellula suecica]
MSLSDHVLTHLLHSFNLPLFDNLLTLNVNATKTRPLTDLMTSVHTMEASAANRVEPFNPPVDKILPNSLYLTFNAPAVDDYHRGLFLTYPPMLCIHEPATSGTLFHATYYESKWVLERRPIKDVSTSTSLVLLYLVATIDPSKHRLDEQFHKINKILEAVPMGKEAREKEFGEVKRGNPVLDGYDCVIWTGDAMRALSKEGLIDLGGRDADDIMSKARALAGPEDARTMVGKDFGGLNVSG